MPGRYRGPRTGATRVARSGRCSAKGTSQSGVMGVGMSLRMVRRVLVALAVVGAAGSGALAAGKPSPVEAKPLTAAVRGKVQPLQPGPLQVPLITWGGDVATILADQE